MQANRVIQYLKKILTGKVTDFLEKWMKDDPEKYTKFWEAFGIYLCEGVITDPDAKDVVLPLLRFQTMNHGTDFRSLSDYVQEMKPDQKKIYYVLGDNLETLRNSPHSESLRKDGIDVLLLTKEYDPLVVTTIGKYQDFDLVNVASDKAEEPKAEDADSEDKDKEKDKESEKPEEEKLEYKPLVELFKSVLGDKVSNVKTTDRLVSSPARLVEGEGALPQEMQRVYRVIQQSYSAPKKVLEVNPDHPLIQKVVESTDESLRNEIIGQVFDDALLMDGETPDQVAMLTRIQNMMMRLLEK